MILSPVTSLTDGIPYWSLKIIPISEVLLPSLLNFNHDKECAAAVERLLMEGILDYREHIQQVEKQKMPGSITPYFWEDFLLANSKREKYLQADGEVALAEKKKMHIVVSFNHKYAMYASVMLQSLYENNPLCNICGRRYRPECGGL